MFNYFAYHQTALDEIVNNIDSGKDQRTVCAEAGLRIEDMTKEDIDYINEKLKERYSDNECF
jgi:hypothetical protein